MEKSTFPVDDAQLNGWCDEFPDTAQALLCVRYALAFNTMDADWLKDTFASTVTYGSQSVLETLPRTRGCVGLPFRQNGNPPSKTGTAATLRAGSK